MDREKLNRFVLIIISVINCIFTIGYSYEIYDLIKEPLIEKTDEMIIDGTDFTAIANLAVTGTNGLIASIITSIYVIITIAVAIILAVIARLIIIKKDSSFEPSEIKFSKYIIVISSVFAFLVSLILTKLSAISFVIALSWQQPLFMLLLYYLPLRQRNINQ